MSASHKFCGATRESMSEHIDGQPLSTWRHITLWVHLHFCPGCRPLWRSLNATKNALADLRDE